MTAASRAIGRLLALAEYYDVDEVLVGMTVLALGTSLPELGSHSSRLPYVSFPQPKSEASSFRSR